MYLMSEDVQYDRNMYHVLTGQITFVVVDGMHLFVFVMMYHNDTNYTTILSLVLSVQNH